MQLPDFKKQFGVEAYIPHIDGLLYKYFNIDRAKDVVMEEALWFSSPEKLNDSFELDVEKIKFDMSDENIKAFLLRYYSDAPEILAEIFERSKSNRDLVADFMQKKMAEIRDECGICCFTTNPCNKRMWALYGNSDTGVVIGFQLPPIILGKKDFFVMKVIYENERSFIDYFNKPHPIFPIWACVKDSDWAYEKEIRAVDMSRKGLHKFALNAVKEIHYGMKTKQEDIA